MKLKKKPKYLHRVRFRSRRSHKILAPHMLTYTICEEQALVEPFVAARKAVWSVAANATTMIYTPDNLFESSTSSDAPSASAEATTTQAAIDAEALAIAKRRMKQHARTWTELAKY